MKSFLRRALPLALILVLLTISPGKILADGAAMHVYHCGPRDTRQIALTFDDGPHPRYTDRILEILAREGVIATFFMIGVNVQRYPEVARRVIAGGHEVGNHTFTHATMKRIPEETLVKEIEENDRILEELGYAPHHIFRPPQGVCTDMLPSVLQQTQKHAILWDIDTRDWAHRPSDEILAEIERHVCGGAIILFHDYISGENTTIPALQKVIPALKERGYEFVTVSQLLDIAY